MPDHVPYHHAEGSQDQAFSFCYGYIIAMLQALSDEGDN
jgi:mannonate dehydratase